MGKPEIVDGLILIGIKSAELVVYAASGRWRKRDGNMKICLKIKLPAIKSDTLLHLGVTFAKYRKFVKVFPNILLWKKKKKEIPSRLP